MAVATEGSNTTQPGTAAPERSGSCEGSFSDRKEQQLAFLLVRQLAAVQFDQAHSNLSERLWQEVAALDIDPERITWLLYGGQDLNDPQALATLDRQWRQERQELERRARRGPLGGLWWRRGNRPLRPAFAGHRNGSPAAAPTRPAGR